MSTSVQNDDWIWPKLRRVLRNIKGRCENPAVHKFEYYGGRGIKNLLTLDDLLVLWKRDNADQMQQPSIDRIDSDGPYALENCRFLEFAENRRRRRYFKHGYKCSRPMTSEMLEHLSRIGRKGGLKGGKAKSEAKTAANRENGKKGGRPRKGTK